MFDMRRSMSFKSVRTISWLEIVKAETSFLEKLSTGNILLPSKLFANFVES